SDTGSGVRPSVSSDRDENTGGRGDGTATVPARDQPVSDVSGSDRDGQSVADGTGSAAGGRGSGTAAVADDPAVAGGQTPGTPDRDGLSVDDRSGNGADSGDDELAGTGESVD